MTKLTRAQFLALTGALAFTAFAGTAAATPPQEADGYYKTGDGVRQKKVAFIKVDVYAIWHFMKALPPSKDKAAVIAMDVDKRFAWTMLRNVDLEKIQNALREAFAMNGYGDKGKIDKFVGAFTGELKDKQAVHIRYSSANKTTTISVAGQGSASVAGDDFMRAVWSIWFGKIDQPSLSDDLLKNL